MPQKEEPSIQHGGDRLPLRATAFQHFTDDAKCRCVLTFTGIKIKWGRKTGVCHMSTKSSKSSRRNIVRDIYGDRYLLTSRRLVQMDSDDAKIGLPWYALNKEIRAAAAEIGTNNPWTYLPVYSKRALGSGAVRVLVRIGADTEVSLDVDRYQIGCAYFTFNTFNRIVKNAGIKTVKKAFAAKAGA